AEDGIRDPLVTGVQTCALPIWRRERNANGRSSRIASRGKTSVPARSKSRPIATLRSKSCGNPSADRSEAAASVNAVKLATSPARSEERRVGKEGKRARRDERRR